MTEAAYCVFLFNTLQIPYLLTIVIHKHINVLIRSAVTEASVNLEERSASYFYEVFMNEAHDVDP